MGRRLRLRRKRMSGIAVLRPTASSPDVAAPVPAFRTRGPSSTTEQLLLLQRSMGNRSVQRMLSRASMAGGSKATTGIGGFIYRKESGGQPIHVARLTRDAPPKSKPRKIPFQVLSTVSLQRACAACAAGGSPCASCANEDTQIQRQEARIPSNAERFENVHAIQANEGTMLDRHTMPKLQRLENALQREDGGDTTGGGPDTKNYECETKEPRCIRDKLVLQAPFWGSEKEPGKRLHKAFHNDTPLDEKKDNGSETVKLLKQALNAAPRPADKKKIQVDDTNGNWDSVTHKRVFEFQADNGIPPGGFEAGRKTLLALDAHLLNTPPPKPPVPPKSDKAEINAKCGEGQDAGALIVSGDNFPGATVIGLSFDAEPQARFSALSDAQGHFDNVKVPLDGRATGPHVVMATATGAVARAGAPFNCGGGKGPQPGPQPFNQKLEDLLDAIGVRHAQMFQLEQNALVRLEADLQPSLQEAASDLALQFLGRAAVDAIASLFAPGIAGLGKAIIEELQGSVGKEAAENITTWAITPVLAGMVDSTKGLAEDKVKEVLAPDPADRAKQLGAFIDGVKEGLLNEQAEKQVRFIRESKPKARDFPKDPSKSAVCSDPDPRVCDAEKALDAMGKAEQDRRDAFNKTYTTAAEKWTVFIAKAALGERDKSTDLSSTSKADPKGARGVLTLQYDGASPTDLFKIRTATIAGFSKITREKLNQQLGSAKVGDLGIPRVTTGCVDLQLSNPGSGCPGRFEVAKNEAGKVFVRGANSDGEFWLVRKGILAAGVPTQEAGAEAVWAQIDSVLVKDLNDGKGIAEP